MNAIDVFLIRTRMALTIARAARVARACQK
jgi:hypothetical protein